MSPIQPYANDADSLEIGELTIENRLDRISMYGAIELTRDKAGLHQARELRQLLDAIVIALETDKNLPENIRYKPTDTVDNPFE